MRTRLTLLARQLRKQSTDAERLLWRHLRAQRFVDCKFRRQQPLGGYIVDFVCFEKKLIVELDGGQHAETVEYDDARTQWLASQGFKVMRFWNNDVLGNTEGVLHTIMTEIETPSPLMGEAGERVVVIFHPPLVPRPSRAGRPANYLWSY